MSEPFVSVILPIRNGERFLAEAVESIQNQTFDDFEFIIINDGSTDNTETILNEYAARDKRIRLVNYAEGKGLVSALNHGIQLARAELIARMDADDVALPERFERQVDYLRAHADCIVVGTELLAIDADGDPLFYERRAREHREILLTLLKARGGLAHPSVMMRKAAFVKAGGYGSCFPVEDLDLWFRMARLGEFGNVGEVLLKYRYHAQKVCAEKYDLQKKMTMEVLDRVEEQFRDILPHDFKRLKIPPPMSECETHIYWSMRACYDGFYRSARKHAWKALRLRPGKESVKAVGRALLYSAGLKRAGEGRD